MLIRNSSREKSAFKFNLILNSAAQEARIETLWPVGILFNEVSDKTIITENHLLHIPAAKEEE